MEHGVTTVGPPRPRRQLESPTRGRSTSRALSERRAWLLVWAIAAVSDGVRSISALRSPRPWIFPDELIYAELARSLAHTGTLSLRGEAIVEAVNVAYPALLALPYTAFDSLPQAYVAAKIVNALVMSAPAAVAYALARRFVSPPSAMVVALLTKLVPSLAYTTTLMTENAFYPLFLLAALAVVRHLEQPSGRRAAVATAVIVVAALTRTQGLMLVPAAWTAAAVIDFTARRWTRTPKLVAAAAAPLGLVIGAQVLLGGSPLALLGRYRAAVESPPGLGDAASTLVTTIAGLDLYVGVIPFAAWLVAWRLFAQRTERERIFLVVSASFTFWLILQVGLFATWTPPSRLMDRYVFYAAPFFFTALVAWLDAPRLGARRQALVATGAAAALIAFVPLDWVGRSGSSDSLALLPLWDSATASAPARCLLQSAQPPLPPSASSLLRRAAPPDVGGGRRRGLPRSVREHRRPALCLGGRECGRRSRRADGLGRPQPACPRGRADRRVEPALRELRGVGERILQRAARKRPAARHRSTGRSAHEARRARRTKRADSDSGRASRQDPVRPGRGLGPASRQRRSPATPATGRRSTASTGHCAQPTSSAASTTTAGRRRSSSTSARAVVAGCFWLRCGRTRSSFRAASASPWLERDRS